MLMIGSAELGKRMYETWARRMDLVDPVKAEGWLGAQGCTKPRSKWEHLTSVQKGVWRDVAREVSGTLADAMGAL